MLLNTIYPPRCLTCSEPTEHGANLCADCWADTTFISGTIFDTCGTPLPGENNGTCIECDGCLTYPPTWDKGRAAVIYDGGGRRVTLALKHGDRLDMAGPLAGWMDRAGRNLLQRAGVIAPVPLHCRRLLKRQYNQSAELARHPSALSSTPTIPDLLIRTKATSIQDSLTRAERLENQRGAFAVHNRRQVQQNILLIDDVMTTGATLSACARALRTASAQRIDVLVFVRVARDD
ncbi:MAG: ComF family protein [Paracoccaceae bacterium]